MNVKTRKQKSKIKAIKNFAPLIVLLAFFCVIALFWNNISWLFNANVWRQLLSDAFPQYFPRPYVLVQSPSISSVRDLPKIKSAGQNSTSTAAIAQKPRRDMVTIPKINITAPIITAKTDNEEIVHSLLDSGVVLYPGSAPFGDTGLTVLLGHSAPAGWPKIKYDWVFSKLDQLKEGDMVVITYDRKTRYYKVVSQRVIEPQTGVPPATNEGNALMLVTCWPPGKDLKRYIVEAAIY